MEKRAPIINRTVLMTDADNFSVKELNLYSHEEIQPNRELARVEHEMVKRALIDAGITVVQVSSPEDCQDSIYTANWAFVSGNIAIASRLPNVRQGEQSYARKVLQDLGKKVLVPKWQRYSGQGDTLVCGDRLFLGSGYRSDKEMQKFLADTYKFHRQPAYDIIPVQTIPATIDGKPVRNKVSHWPDSKFYDIDLAMGIVDQETIAWCPEAFLPESQDRIAALDVRQIIVDKKEAEEAFACNFISTGHEVVMGTGAPKLQSAIETQGLKTTTLDINELIKGGGFIRCIALTLDND
jgi:N-dimethylarginine dimethylaminohydrolase